MSIGGVFFFSFCRRDILPGLADIKHFGTAEGFEHYPPGKASAMD
jgi:hypothetical protein